MSRTVDPKLLEILVCPLTKSALRYDPDRQELVSERARLAYPIRDGIPIMLVDEARPLDEGEVEGEVGAPPDLAGGRNPGVDTGGRP
ncbi:MAG: Trm112 family protein [Rhodospirillales bacterium]|nr:MAG: Trm112 family protein [Rhodospirillales bacterium]